MFTVSYARINDIPMFARLTELAALFFKLGVIGFGGPAAHIAAMEDEVVTRRKWISREHFLDLVGATNLIPGPNSTEMAIHVGYQRCGLLGLITAGVCFIGPAVVITCLFAWLYQEYGTLPELNLWFYGIKPAVLAIIAGAGYRLGKKVFKTKTLIVFGFCATAVLLSGVDALWCLLIVSVSGWLWLLLIEKKPSDTITAALFGATFWHSLFSAPASASMMVQKTNLCPLFLAASSELTSPEVWKLGLFFLKVGAILYGGGYVLIAYLRSELVGQYGFTEQQLLDAIAIGQFTPGPILSTATFVGYQIAGIPGAVVSTLGIFLPSFVVVAIANPLIPKLRNSRIFSKLLDSVNATSIGLLLAVTIDMSIKVFASWDISKWQAATEGAVSISSLWPSWAIFVVALIALIRYKVSSFWIVIGGSVLGAGLLSISG